MGLPSYFKSLFKVSLWEGQLRIVQAVLTRRVTIGNTTTESNRFTCRVGHKVGSTFAAAAAIAAWVADGPIHSRVVAYESANLRSYLAMFSAIDERDVRWSASPSAFEGDHKDVLYVVDDAEDCPAGIIPAIQRATLAGGARGLVIGRPKAKGSDFYLSHAPEAGWGRIHIASPAAAATDVSGLATTEWVEEMRTKWGEESTLFRTRVMGEFPGGPS